MRIAILSDIHANYEALSASVSALRSMAIDEYYCLGDTVGYGGSPQECVTIVRQLAKATVVGNHDAAVAGRMDYSYYYEAARKALDVHTHLIAPKDMQWLETLPYKVVLPQHNVDLCHGSPIRLEDFEYIFAPEQARECLPIWHDLSQLTFIGHSHLCKVFELTQTTAIELPADSQRLHPDRKYIVSVGSIGQPRDFDNRASFVVFDTEARELSFCRVEYDVEAAAEKVLQRKLERNFAQRLVIGV